MPPRDLSAHLKSATLSEFDSKSLLRDAGIALPDEVLVTERDGLDAAIARVGFPLVMKIQSRDIPHKSEVGGVRVNITTKGEAFSAYQALLDNARQHRPNAAIQGVLVGPMAKKGVEIIVGTMTDATFGPMIMVGLGGITTELFRDVIYRPAPVSAAEASAMLAELKAAPLLNGFRGAAKADIAALSQLIAQVSVLAARHASEISEIELNPVLVHAEGQGVTIVDALVVREESSVAESSPAHAEDPERMRDQGPDASPRRIVGRQRKGEVNHRPLKFATRRSAVALTPSLKSSVARSLFCSTSSWLVAASTRSARPARMVARVEIRPSGEHSAISAASFMASARTWSCGTQTLARPIRVASSPVTRRLV